MSENRCPHHPSQAERIRSRFAPAYWRTSRKGNQYLSVEGFVVTIFPRGARWCWSIKRSLAGFVGADPPAIYFHPEFVKSAHSTIDEAKADALRRLVEMTAW